MEVGDKLELMKLPGSGELYLEGGIYASPGNFAFDIGLLVFELFLIGAAIVRLVVGSRQEAGPASATT